MLFRETRKRDMLVRASGMCAVAVWSCLVMPLQGHMVYRMAAINLCDLQLVMSSLSFPAVKLCSTRPPPLPA